MLSAVRRVTTERQGRAPALPTPSQSTVLRPASLLLPLEPGCQLWGGWWLSGLTSGCISGQEKDEPVESHIPLEKPKNTSRGKAGRNLAQCFGKSVSVQREGKHGAARLLPTHWFLFRP